MRRKLFVVMLMVLAAPALAQERGRSERQPSRPSASRQTSRQHDRQSYHRPAPRPRPYVRPYYRSYYPSYRYGGYYGDYYGGYGYGGYYGRGYGYGRSVLTGLKFHLELVPKAEQELVKQGIVSIDGAEVGIVNRHDGWWNGPVPVSTGDHEVVVEHPDGRVFRTQVFVQPGQVLHVYLRFPKP